MTPRDVRNSAEPPGPGPLYRAVAAELRRQRERVVNAGPMPAVAHNAMRHLLVAARELEDAADEVERRGNSG